MSEQQIISFLKQNGPSTPAQLAKFLNISQLFASAMLGEVSSKGVAKISALKIGGGSPLYYLKEDSEKLQNYANNLNSKDKQAYELLKQEKVLRDKEMTPIVRISLRTIKDFAVQLNIIRNNQNEIFWKWYLINDKEAENKIREIFEKENPKKEDKEITQSIKKEQKNEIKKQAIVEKTLSENPIKDKIQKNNSNQLKTIQSDSKLSDFDNAIDNNENLIDDFLKLCNNGFGKKIINYINDKKIKIIKFDQIKKNKEFTFTFLVPSTIGNSKFYCHALDKKKITESELALVMIEGQHNKLPAILFITGELSKKAREQKDILFKDLHIING